MGVGRVVGVGGGGGVRKAQIYEGSEGQSLLYP